MFIRYEKARIHILYVSFTSAKLLRILYFCKRAQMGEIVTLE